MNDLMDSESNQINLYLLREQRKVINMLLKQIEDLRIELAGHQPVTRHLTVIKNFSHEVSKRREGLV